jgi:hypothetical protein
MEHNKEVDTCDDVAQHACGSSGTKVKPRKTMMLDEVNDAV